eukprot:1160154-Pelagomonas_calceolata.AAC.1
MLDHAAIVLLIRCANVCRNHALWRKFLSKCTLSVDDDYDHLYVFIGSETLAVAKSFPSRSHSDD